MKNSQRPAPAEAVGCTMPGTESQKRKFRIHYVVTENGVANLKGLSSTERAHALIGLAHPAFQDELTTAAKESHLI